MKIRRTVQVSENSDHDHGFQNFTLTLDDKTRALADDGWNEEEVGNAEALAGDSQNEDELSPIKTEVDNDIASAHHYRTFTRIPHHVLFLTSMKTDYYTLVVKSQNINAHLLN